VEDFTWGSAFDSFSQLAQGYMGMKVAEAQADATGQAQAQLATTVERPAGATQTPLNTAQYQTIGANVSGGASGGSLPFGLTQNQLMIGAAAIGALLFLKK